MPSVEQDVKAKEPVEHLYDIPFILRTWNGLRVALPGYILSILFQKLISAFNDNLTLKKITLNNVGVGKVAFNGSSLIWIKE